MNVLFLSHRGLFDWLVRAINEFTSCRAAAGLKLESTPMKDPDFILIDLMSMYLTFEDERAMGISSKPKKGVFISAAPAAHGGPLRVDWRMLAFNHFFFTPALVDNVQLNDMISKDVDSDDRITLHYLPIPINTSFFPRRREFDYTVSPLMICQSLSEMFNKNTSKLKKACALSGVKLALLFGLSQENLAHNRLLCHAAFDNMVRGAVGRSGLETMSHGIPTVCYVARETLAGYAELGGGDSFPVANVSTTGDLTKLLSRWSLDRDELRATGESQAAWMASYYSPKKIAEFYVAKISSLLAG